MTQQLDMEPQTFPTDARSCVIENVPMLGWGKQRECTFLGALEAALSVTERPYAYDDLMGFTALAFRTRWWKANEKATWCPSCAVGEMREEMTAASRATGWELRTEFHFDDVGRREPMAAQVAASIDAGRPVLAYDPSLNLGVIYGYRDGGRRARFRHYGTKEMPAADRDDYSLDDLGWMWTYLGERRDPLPRGQAVTQGLRAAGNNWRRVVAQHGPGEYWYGAAAYERWIDDLSRADEFTDDERGRLFFVSWWNFDTLCDARRAAVRFLERNIAAAPSSSPQKLYDALEVYRELSARLDEAMHGKSAFQGPWSGRSIVDWTEEVRDRERRLLNQAMDLDAKAIAAIEDALPAD